MTILVTGATGFIGKKVVLKLAEKNIDIVAADIDLGTNKEVLLEVGALLGHGWFHPEFPH